MDDGVYIVPVVGGPVPRVLLYQRQVLHHMAGGCLVEEQDSAIIKTSPSLQGPCYPKVGVGGE